jgi:hypothetical protein
VSIKFVTVETLIHIEDFSPARVEWLADKIQSEGFWTVPIKVERNLCLVMDGQHRMEAAKKLGLRVVPAVELDYADVEVWSLREGYEVKPELIVQRALSGEIYPYKTAKHKFPAWADSSSCIFSLDALRKPL